MAFKLKSATLTCIYIYIYITHMFVVTYITPIMGPGTNTHICMESADWLAWGNGQEVTMQGYRFSDGPAPWWASS